MNELGQSSKVQQFISDLADIDTEKFEIVTELYSLLSKANKNFTDKFIYGGIGIYVGDTLIGGIWVSKKHVSLVFSDGYKLDDSYKVLEGSGKYRRHIKVQKFEDIKQKSCKEYIQKLFNLYK